MSTSNVQSLSPHWEWHIRCETKFPPDQYYIDQILKIHNELNQVPLFVQLFTDDRNPQALLERIKSATNQSNIIFYYHDNRGYSYKDRVAQDLYNMARCDVLIRGQSYFSRAAELVGSHKVVIHPLESRIQNNKLIMTKIAIKGYIPDLINR